MKKISAAKTTTASVYTIIQQSFSPYCSEAAHQLPDHQDLDPRPVVSWANDLPYGQVPGQE